MQRRHLRLTRSDTLFPCLTPVRSRHLVRTGRMTAAAPRTRLALVVAGLACLAAALILAPSPASARTDIAPYLEVQQVLSADLNDSDVLTYTAAVAGIDGRVSTRRFKAQKIGRASGRERVCQYG